MLTAPIVEILRDLHHALILDFWPCWLALSAVVVIGATWFVSRSSAPRSERRADTNIVLARRPVGTPASIVALGVLVAFLVAYIAMTLVWEDFTYVDNSLFTLELGIVLSIIWAVGAGIYTRNADVECADDFAKFAYKVCSDSKSLDHDSDLSKLQSRTRAAFGDMDEGERCKCRDGGARPYSVRLACSFHLSLYRPRADRRLSRRRAMGDPRLAQEGVCRVLCGGQSSPRPVWAHGRLNRHNPV
jgi:hypothetical protein